MRQWFPPWIVPVVQRKFCGILSKEMSKTEGDSKKWCSLAEHLVLCAEGPRFSLQDQVSGDVKDLQPATSVVEHLFCVEKIQSSIPIKGANGLP